MGIDAFAALAYGINAEDFDFPWNNDKTPEDWWCEVNNFVNPKPCPLTDDQKDWKPELNEVERTVMFDAWFDAKNEWLDENPLPFEVIDIGNSEHPTYMIAVICTRKEATLYDTEKINEPLSVNAEALFYFNQFVDKYMPELSDEPRGWYLSAYMNI